MIALVEPLLTSSGVRKLLSLEAMRLFVMSLISLLALSFFIGQSIPVNAVSLVPDYNCSTPNPDGTTRVKAYGRYDLEGMLDIAQTTTQFILGISGALALLMFFYGGVLWLISGGEDAKVTQGREALTQATVGLIIILGSWVFVNFVVVTLRGGEVNPEHLFGKAWSSYTPDCMK